MIKRKPIPTNINPLDYNNNNLHEYDPYILTEDNTLIIDEEWYLSLTDYIKSLINNRLSGKYILGKVNIPHIEQKLDCTDRLLTTVYQAYLEGFDYNVWYNPDIPNGPKNVKLIKMSNKIKEHFLNKDVTDFDDLITFKNNIQLCLEPNKDYFIRLSSTSGKNEKSIRPFNDVNKIIKHLMSVKLFEEQEYSQDKETYLIISPWNNIIDPRCEFRIFVVNNRITAASPQRYWELHQHSSEELESFEHALNNISFIGNNIPYHTFVADVFIDVETSICHLIELNPFGAHCGAGSSLFNWYTDYDILYGLTKDAPELRYLSAINY